MEIAQHFENVQAGIEGMATTPDATLSLMEIRAEIKRLEGEVLAAITEKETYYANGLQAQVELRQEIKRLDGEVRSICTRAFQCS